jgi:hypothetical protein
VRLFSINNAFLIVLILAAAFPQYLIAAANWSSPPIDVSGLGENAGDSQISISSDGSKATAVWVRSNGMNLIIQSASATITGNSASWSSVTNLSAIGGDAVSPRISLSSDGTKATTVWYRSNGLTHVVQSASATITGNIALWSPVTDVSATSDNSKEPEISLSRDGTKATVVWRVDGLNFVIKSASATITGNNASWSVVTDLSAPGGDAWPPRISLSSDGSKATAIWPRFNGSDRIIQTSSAIISGNSATWSPVTDLSAAGENASAPEISISQDGLTATAIWTRFNGSNYTIQSSAAIISGNSATWSFVADLSASGGDAWAPGILLSGDGTKVTAIWYRSTGTDSTVQSSSAVITGNSANWSSALDLSAADRDASAPQLSLSSDGTKATAVWMLTNGGQVINQSSCASIIGNRASWSAVSDLSYPVTDTWPPLIFPPQISLSSDGTKATAVWERFNGSNYITQSSSATIAYIFPSVQSVVGQVGVPISSTSVFNPEGFSGPLNFSVNPSLPTGLSMDASTGVITGIPTTAQTSINYVVTARDPTSGSATATISISINIPPAPSSPSVTSVSGGNEKITVVFDASTGVITDYTASCTSSNGGKTGTVTGSSSPLVVTGLSNGKNYTCTVTANGPGGSSPSSLASSVVIPNMPPPPSNPIPTLSDWAKIMMMLAMIATAGLYGWRIKQQ